MSMISELVDRLRTESKSMGKYGVDYMATLLARSADTIEMLSKKARADTLQSCFHCDHYEPKGWCNLFEDTVSPNYKCCSEFAEIKPYEYEIKALHKDYQEPYCEIADAPQTERIKTHDYCDICNHKGCGTCIANNLDDYCVPSSYAPKDTPQTDDKDINVRSKDEPQKDCKKCKNYDRCKNNRWKCCVYEPKDEPQTDCGWK